MLQMVELSVLNSCKQSGASVKPRVQQTTRQKIHTQIVSNISKKNIFSKYLIASGSRRAMDTSNQFDFGLDSVMNASGFDYAGDGMNRGLPDFPIQFPGKKGYIHSKR